MENEETITLLREIRDLQRLHVENYKDALKNQQLAIEVQQKASRFQKKALVTLVVVVLVMIALLFLFPTAK